MKFETLFLVIIKKGPVWSPGSTPELEKLQADHLAHIDHLRSERIMVAAGPVDDGSCLRGISVLRVESLDKAIELAEADPSVRAGRLTIEVHPWLVPEGVFS
jgi:uncharacterized protein YciI